MGRFDRRLGTALAAALCAATVTIAAPPLAAQTVSARPDGPHVATQVPLEFSTSHEDTPFSQRGMHTERVSKLFCCRARRCLARG